MNNNRIKQLAEQVGITFSSSHISETGYDYIAAEIEPQDLEKFAELIIQECAEQLEANRVAVYDANKHHEYWNCGVKWAVAKLQNHFGVKLKYIDCNDTH